MMRALLSVAPGGPDSLVLRDVPKPVPKAGELLVEVETCGVNYPDALIIEDRYQGRFERPFAPGGEIAGHVRQVGPDVTGFACGDRIVAFTMVGGMAEFVCVPARAAYRIGPAHPGGEAAQLPTTYATAFHALVDRGRIQPGERVLVLGAGGGVGLACIDVARALGAHVVGAVSSEEKARAARAAGAHDVLIYAADPDQPGATLAERFKILAGKEGVDIIFDPVGGPLSEAAFRAIAWGGRHLVVGFPGGIPALPLNLPLLKGADIAGVFMGRFAELFPAHARDNVTALLALYERGHIRPTIAATFALADAPRALVEVAARRSIGKLVVTVADTSGGD